MTDRLNESEEHVRQLMRTSERPVSLDTPLQGEEDITRIDSMSDPSAPRTDDNLMKESLHKDIESVLSNLPHNESIILKLAFGIGHSHSYSIDEIALRMSLSRERVRQIQNKALSHLQRSSTKELLRAYL